MSVLTACLASACGRVGYDPLPLSDVDAAVDVTTECILGPWEDPVELAIEGADSATFFGGPAPSADGLTLVFGMRLGDDSEDIYYATRTDPESSYFEGTARIDVSTSGAEGTPALSADGLTLYFFAESGGDGHAARDLYYARRAPDASWAGFSPRTLLPNVNDLGADQGPKLTLDGLALVFSSTRPGSRGEDLYLADRASTADEFGSPKRVARLASRGRDTGASLTADGLGLYYASDGGGTGDLDIWFASRPGRASAFGRPTAVLPVNTGADEFDAAISADGLELFFVSTRGGSSRLWHSLRHCLP